MPPPKKRKKAQKLMLSKAYKLTLLGAIKGGLARAKILSPRRRSQIARQAALARWSRKKLKRAA